jgi:predicted outer membrane repeat protein
MSASIRSRLGTAVHGALVVLSALPSIVGAASWIVNPTGIGDDFPTVQAAIYSSQVVNGDTVLLRDGTYTGDGNRDIDLQGKRIVVRSMSMNPQNCVIDCQGSVNAPRRGFFMVQGENNSTWIQAIKIANGYSVYAHGAGIYIDGNTSPVIDHCIIQNCVADGGLGGGIFCGGTSAPVIQNCQILGNRSGGLSPGNGGGICGWSGATPAITGCTVSRNNAGTVQGPGKGGGIFIMGGSVDFCTVSDNHAVSDGGGIYSDAAQISNSDITGNTTAGGGGGLFLNGGSLTFSTISGNAGIGNTGSPGGGLMAGGATIGRCTITGNLSYAYLGGGVFCGDCTFDGCTISGNYAYYGGGANAVNTVFRNTIIWGNCGPVEGNEIRGDATDTLVCCCVNPTGVFGAVNYSGAQVFTDPIFCARVSCNSAPTTQGIYTLGNTSPCLPANSPCGSLIGNYGQGCATAGAEELAIAGLDLRTPAVADGPMEIRWSTPEQGSVEMAIYDVQGRRVAELVDGTAVPSGEHRTTWSGRIDDGALLARGVYFVRLETAVGTLTRRVVLLGD